MAMLFTTANTNCRDVAQLQKDLIGNEGFCSLLAVSQGRTPGSAPEKQKVSLLWV